MAKYCCLVPRCGENWIKKAAYHTNTGNFLTHFETKHGHITINDKKVYNLKMLISFNFFQKINIEFTPFNIG